MYVLGGEAGHGAKTLFYILVLCMLSHFIGTRIILLDIYSLLSTSSLSLFLVTTSPQ